MKVTQIVFMIILCLHNSYAQIRDTIKLKNPSFEDTPEWCKVPEGWTDCGLKSENPPDIQPAIDLHGKPLFGVTQDAMDGNTFLELAVRDRDSYEHIAQRLEKPLKLNHCYSFSIYLCRSDIFWAVYKIQGRSEDFTKPVVCRIWGGNALFCSRKQLLGISEKVVNTSWKKYNFEFQAKSDLKYFQLEAYYNSINYTYHGHLLLDNASDIIEIDCDTMNKN